MRYSRAWGAGSPCPPGGWDWQRSAKNKQSSFFPDSGADIAVVLPPSLCPCEHLEQPKLSKNCWTDPRSHEIIASAYAYSCHTNLIYLYSNLNSSKRMLGCCVISSWHVLLYTRRIVWCACVFFSPPHLQQDKYLHTNCLAALANMSAQFRTLHQYAAQRIIR